MKKIIKISYGTWLQLTRIKNGLTFDEIIKLLIKSSGKKVISKQIKKMLLFSKSKI